LQILGCELHQNAFDGRALPGPAGRAITLLAVIMGKKGGKGKEMIVNMEGEGRA